MNEQKSFWEEKIKIKNFNIPRFMSAPMDGITDSPMRQLIRTFSPEILLFTEMRHVATIANDKKEKSLEYSKIEHPICFQISAGSTIFLHQAIEKIIDKKFDMINLNAGCPARRVVGSGSGSKLMENISQLQKIIHQCIKIIDNRTPFSLKIRAGYKEKNAYDIALMAQDLGVDFLIIHPRTQQENFIGTLDFKLVEKIKTKVYIPLIFSGNITSFESTKKTYELTGVDGFMIGRALLGAPWKIHEIMQKSIGNKFNISNKQSVKSALEHLNLNSKFYGSQVGFKLLKSHIAGYIKNIPNAAKIRNAIVTCTTEQDMQKKLTELIKIL
ncbi:hypothetical protein GF322_04595 [Candidatus Dependentiae bacterium]|nr:hypothetical protein [Candidatus Dependentiae bacterium]